MSQKNYEIYSNFTPILNTAKALIKERGESEIFNILTESHVSVVNTNYDNLNGGTYEYTININLPVKSYSILSHQRISEIESIIKDSLNEVLNDNHCFFYVKITPSLSINDIEWEKVDKNKLKYNIETLKEIMISVATGRNLIKNVNEKYKTLQIETLNNCRKINLIYNNTYKNLWNWKNKWEKDFKTYQQRRLYINELFSPTLVYFEEIKSTKYTDTYVELKEWKRIDRTIIKINEIASTATNEEDFQTVGLLCRDVIISLAQAVYIPQIHGNTDENGTTIGASDAVRMLKNYINFTLSSKDNKELRDYIKAANSIANQLTHKRSATKKDMLLTISSTISLINFIGIIEDKF